MIYYTSVPRKDSTKNDRLAWIKMQDNEESPRSNLEVFTLLPSVKIPP